MTDDENVPNLDTLKKQAIPLDTPVTKALREFSGQATTARATAVIAIAITDAGQILLAMAGQGGIVQTLGLLEAGSAIVGKQLTTK
ncbi:hypothetical protein LCGC14_0409850 [marine sediment metagenome]|uniref:Uncharacterized protein n=1 Tax=marine sediment metagenome TaxID=412755 RepID=A0A0F9VG33_9ZZZZ